MTTSIKEIDRTRWHELTRLFLDYNYRQTWDFGNACAERVGAISEHVAASWGGRVLGLADVRIKRTPVFNTGIAYINGGPLVRQGKEDDASRLQTCLGVLREEYVNRRGLVLRIAPPLGSADWNAKQTAVCIAAGFGPATHAASYRTLVLDIDRPLDDIRKSFAQRWRNYLKRSEKSGLVIRSSTGTDLFGEFCVLYERMIGRKQFRVDLSAGFYARVQKQLSDGNRFYVSLADYEGQPVAGHVASILGETCVYLLGASEDAGLKVKASHLLHWHVIQIARERSCRLYDLGGIDPEANPGVYQFKHGLSTNDVTSPGPFEAQPRGIRRYLVSGGERAYRAVRRVYADYRG